MLGAVVRENTEPVPDGGGLSRGPETQPHLGIATSPTVKVPQRCSASMQGAKAVWAVWAADPRVAGPASAFWCYSLWASVSQRILWREDRARFWQVQGLAMSSPWLPWLFGVSSCFHAALSVLCFWLRLWDAGALRTAPPWALQAEVQSCLSGWAILNQASLLYPSAVLEMSQLQLHIVLELCSGYTARVMLGIFKGR